MTFEFIIPSTEISNNTMHKLINSNLLRTIPYYIQILTTRAGNIINTNNYDKHFTFTCPFPQRTPIISLFINIHFPSAFLSFTKNNHLQQHQPSTTSLSVNSYIDLGVEND